MRFRHSSFRHVSLTFPSTLPPRFRHVCVAFPLRFRSRFRFRWASACPTETTPRKLAQHCGATALGRPSRSETKTALAQWLRPRLVTCGLGFDPGGRRFEACPPICCQTRMRARCQPSFRVRCDGGPRGAQTRMCFNVFAAAPENLRSHVGHVGSSVFQRFHQRFRHVSITLKIFAPQLFKLSFVRVRALVSQSAPLLSLRPNSSRFNYPPFAPHLC